MGDVTFERWRKHARSGYGASVSNDLRNEIASALEARVKASAVAAPFTQAGAASWSIGTTLSELADVAMAIVQPRLDALVDLMERLPEVHMRFGVIGQGPPTECADWCDACRMQRANERADDAEATTGRLADVLVMLMGAHQNTEPHRDLNHRVCQGCRMFRELLDEPAIVAAKERHRAAIVAALGNAIVCSTGDEWPCATIRALDGEADDR